MQTFKSHLSPFPVALNRSSLLLNVNKGTNKENQKQTEKKKKFKFHSKTINGKVMAAMTIEQTTTAVTLTPGQRNSKQGKTPGYLYSESS